MPKMKDKKSENKEDEDKKTSQKDSSVTDADSEKAFYLTQIRYLDEQLERWGKKKQQQQQQNSPQLFRILQLMWQFFYPGEDTPDRDKFELSLSCFQTKLKLVALYFEIPSAQRYVICVCRNVTLGFVSLSFSS